MSSNALHLSYHMQRSDYVALTRALVGRSFWRPLLILAGFYATVFCFVMAAVGDAGTPLDVLTVIGTGQAPLWFYPILLIGPVLAFLRPYYLGLIAARLYRRNALADKHLRFTFKSDAIECDTAEIQSRFLWSAVKAIIETPAHAFLMLSRREALIVPRRALPTPEDFEELMSFSRARIVANRPATKA